ncbi:hypothetical protein C8R44DRAFT_749389 [Mycena epipterygia]|nr:hypothetical protein C8R44DRAFT_749389 [Mycena epipterygia]
MSRHRGQLPGYLNAHCLTAVASPGIALLLDQKPIDQFASSVLEIRLRCCARRSGHLQVAAVKVQSKSSWLAAVSNPEIAVLRPGIPRTSSASPSASPVLEIRLRRHEHLRVAALNTFERVWQSSLSASPSNTSQPYRSPERWAMDQKALNQVGIPLSLYGNRNPHPSPRVPFETSSSHRRQSTRKVHYLSILLKALTERRAGITFGLSASNAPGLTAVIRNPWTNLASRAGLSYSKFLHPTAVAGLVSESPEYKDMLPAGMLPTIDKHCLQFAYDALWWRYTSINLCKTIRVSSWLKELIENGQGC